MILNKILEDLKSFSTVIIKENEDKELDEVPVALRG